MFRICAYTVTDDTGFAPHIKDGWISLACCSGPTRKGAEVGDFVLGVSGSTMDGVKKHVPIYLMKVEEKLSFDEYFHREEFRGRVDNFYEKVEGEGYKQNRKFVDDERYKNRHPEGEDPEKSEYVLLSQDFYYFGDRWKIDENLCEKMEDFCKSVGFTFVPGFTYKEITDEDEIRGLIEFFGSNYNKGKIGEPNHLPSTPENSCGSCNC